LIQKPDKEKIMRKPKIVVCDHIHQKGLDTLANSKEIEYINLANEPKDSLPKLIKDATVIITRSSTDVNDALLEFADELKAIVRAGVGVDNVDINACSKKGIVVMNVPTANTIAAVELTMAHMLSCMRKFPYAHSQLKDKRSWKREDWYGRELNAKKLGVIGFGNIGSRVATRALAFGMEVVAYDPYIKASKATDLGAKYTANFDDILACDIITIHTPKNKETVNMITSKEITKMRDGVVLINCARGGLYNESDLYEGLKSNKISFAGMDVFNKEPATDNPLLDLDNICVTAHLGANTLESQEKISIEAADQALNAAKGVSYPNALNLPVKVTEVSSFTLSFIELAQKMAFLATQINKGALESVKIKAQGEIAAHLEPLATFAAVGAGRQSLGENVNYVNAQFLMKERGIEISTSEETNASGYKNKITVKITTNQGVTSIGATCFDENTQRILDIDGFELDVEPKGKMIFFKNKDVPGVIGEVGTTLGKHGINISDFRLGRNNNSEAMAVIIVDNDIGEEVLAELSSLKAAISVSYAIL
jgi:D-3-phosphoglycerate dehydrogenase / 2-oxoglutarate reductase